MNNSRIHDLNINEKPREKLLNQGATNLTDQELIAILLGSGGKDKSAIALARELLNDSEGLKNLLGCDIQRLLKHKYINIAKASVIKATMEISIRVQNNIPVKGLQITRPEDVYRYLRKDLSNQSREHLVLLSIDSRNRVISKDIISIGSLNETIVSPREVFSVALNKSAACIIIAHNHPSNDSTPSQEDIKVTEKIAFIGKEMNIPLLDHLIITNSDYISMKQLNIFTTFDNSKSKGGDNSEKQ